MAPKWYTNDETLSTLNHRGPKIRIRSPNLVRYKAISGRLREERKDYVFANVGRVALIFEQT